MLCYNTSKIMTRKISGTKTFLIFLRFSNFNSWIWMNLQTPRVQPDSGGRGLCLGRLYFNILNFWKYMLAFSSFKCQMVWLPNILCKYTNWKLHLWWATLKRHTPNMAQRCQGFMQHRRDGSIGATDNHLSSIC